MDKLYVRLSNFLIFAVLMPFVYGCNSGGEGAQGASSFLGSVAEAGGGSGGLTGGEVATIVNPEPASMLLIGGGLVAMAYYKNKNRKSS
jgi:hypothetical protein